MSREKEGGKRLKASPKKSWWKQLRRWWRVNWYHRRGTMIALMVCCVLLAVVTGAGIWWTNWAVEPDMPDYSGGKKDDLNTPIPGDGSGEDPDDFNYIEVDPDMPDYVSNQKKGFYTFLLLGRSDKENYTDMIMLATFDMNTGDVNIASIPRDLMINVSRDIKKINSASGNGDVKNMMKWVRKTTGIQPNFYVLLDWAAVGQLVEEVGGVYFDVPQRMHYIDSTPKTGFVIDLQPGYQLLDGDKAMQLIRWRKNNVENHESPGDGARMEVQQNFMKAAVKQILVPKNILKLGTFATIFTENVETDLTVGNLVWFAQQALKLDSVNKLAFHSLPGNYEVRCWSRTFKDKSDNGGRMQYYVTLYPNQLLELVNTKLNPYEKKITLGDLDLMSCTDGHLLSSTTGYVADTVHEAAYQEWRAVRDGEAYYDEEGNLVYGDPDDPDGPGDPDDPDSPHDPDDPDGPDGPDSPGGPDDPHTPDGPDSSDPNGDSGTTPPEDGTQDGGDAEGPEGGDTVDVDGGDSGDSDSTDGGSEDSQEPAVPDGGDTGQIFSPELPNWDEILNIE